MSKQTETARTDTKRAPYEAPRLTVIELRPEEALLTCLKTGPCMPMLMLS